MTPSRLKPGSMVSKLVQAACEEQRSEQQHDRERDLGDDQRAPNPRPTLGPPSRREPTRASRRLRDTRVAFSAGASPNSTEVSRQAAGKREHAPVDADRQDEPSRWCRAARRTLGSTLRATRRPAAPPSEGEHQAFGEQLADDAPPRRARGRSAPRSPAGAPSRAPAAGWPGSRTRSAAPARPGRAAATAAIRSHGAAATARRPAGYAAEL